jgi:hypothetical protein
VVLNATAIQAVFNQSVGVSNVPTNTLAHDRRVILDPVIFGSTYLSSPFKTHAFQNAEGQDNLYY